MKLVLAAAMWNNPHLLIMDEPTNYLDRVSRAVTQVNFLPACSDCDVTCSASAGHSGLCKCM